MKKIFGILLIAILVSGGSYLFWKKQARKLELLVAEQIDAINASAKKHYGTEVLSYERLSTTGYPDRMILTMHNPVFTVHYGEAPSLPEGWVEENRFTGTVSIGTDWRGSDFFFAMEGERHTISLVNGKPAFERVATTDGPAECSLKLKTAPDDSFPRPFQTLSQFSGDIGDIRQIKCSLKGYHMADKANAEAVYYHVDAAEAEWNYLLEDDTLRVELAATVDNAQSGAAMEPYLKELTPIFNAKNLTVTINDLPAHFLSRLGANSLDFKGHYSGPAKKIQINSPFELSIDTLKISNAMVEGEASLHISGETTEAAQQFTLRSQNSATFTPLYDSFTLDQLSRKLIAERPYLNLLGIGIDLRPLTDEQIRQMSQELLPSLAMLSPMRFTLAATGALDKKFTGLFSTPATATLDTLSVETGQWNLSLSGKSTKQQNTLLPSASLSGTCERCDALFKTLETLARNADKWRLTAQPDAAPIVTEPFLRDLYRFVNALTAGKATAPNAAVPGFENLTFKLEFNRLLPLINGLSLPQINTLLNEFIIPHLGTTPAPPAPAMVPTTPALGIPAVIPDQPIDAFAPEAGQNGGYPVPYPSYPVPQPIPMPHPGQYQRYP